MKSLGDSEASLEEIAAVFGSRYDKNGWHYRLHSTPDMQSFVQDLYKRVFRKENVLNNTIFLEFARVVVAESKGIHVNWAAYAILSEKKHAALERSRKARNEILGRATVLSPWQVPCAPQPPLAPGVVQVLPSIPNDPSDLSIEVEDTQTGVTSTLTSDTSTCF